MAPLLAALVTMTALAQKPLPGELPPKAEAAFAYKYWHQRCRRIRLDVAVRPWSRQEREEESRAAEWNRQVWGNVMNVYGWEMWIPGDSSQSLEWLRRNSKGEFAWPQH